MGGYGDGESGHSAAFYFSSRTWKPCIGLLVLHQLNAADPNSPNGVTLSCLLRSNAGCSMGPAVLLFQCRMGFCYPLLVETLGSFSQLFSIMYCMRPCSFMVSRPTFLELLLKGCGCRNNRLYLVLSDQVWVYGWTVCPGWPCFGPWECAPVITVQWIFFETCFVFCGARTCRAVYRINFTYAKSKKKSLYL